MDRKDENKQLISSNKKALFDYHLLEKYETGIALKGTEVKSLRVNGASLHESYADLKNNEVYLINCHISPYQYGNRINHDPLRNKKLLLHKDEINKISRKIKEKNLTLIPLKIYLKNGLIKVEIALAKGKKLYDKRERLKEKDIEREVERETRFKIKLRGR
ncbi:SsrA-binding protein SmpB [bacterium]|nr:SsrA-binding protein SmpB [bacterium]MBU1781816.1 SsrA-binding protein SmpB [bacterium]